jgi:hypothetical protein
MRAVINDPDVQRDVIDYLTCRPASRCSEVAEALHMSSSTCERLLLHLAIERRVRPETLDLSGYGKPARLWSVVKDRPPSTVPIYRINMTPHEMAADIAGQIARQPWPAWFYLRRPAL